MTTTVLFKFVTPDGTPIADTEFTVTLRKAAFHKDEQGLIYPDDVIGVTAADGTCELGLKPANKPYYLTMNLEDTDHEEKCGSGIRFRFMVPTSDNPVSIRDLIVTDPTWSQTWDEEAMAIIVDAKASAQASADRAKADADRAELSAENTEEFAIRAEAAAVAADASKTAAAGSASAAAGSATAASGSATNAANSATAAAGSATTAGQHKDAAAASATAASGSAAAALASQNAAKTSETNAKTSETNAKQSETAAAGSATAASVSATASANSATASQTSRLASEAARDAAKTSETLARQYAVNPEDVPVSGSNYSAYHWAKKAEAMAGDKQPLNAKLTALSELVLQANEMIISGGADSLTAIATSATGRAVLGGTPAEGRVALDALGVGQFGLGATNAVGTSPESLDSATLANGVYRVDVPAAGFKGLPQAAYGVWTNRLNTTVAVSQLALNYNTSDLYVRNDTGQNFNLMIRQGSFGIGSGQTPTLTDLTATWAAGFYVIPANAPGLPTEAAATGGVFLALRVNFGILISLSVSAEGRMTWTGARSGATGAVTWSPIGTGAHGLGLTTNPALSDFADASIGSGFFTGFSAGHPQATPNGPPGATLAGGLSILAIGGVSASYKGFLAIQNNMSGGGQKTFIGAKAAAGAPVWREVLHAGDYGIGGRVVAANANLNTMLDAGNYWTPVNTTNGPYASGTGNAQGYLEVIPHTTTGYLIQRFTSINAPTVTWLRRQGAGVWADWEMQFTQSTVVGVVEQIAGKPTGAIVQRVENANGKAVKYADGTLICWQQQTGSTVCSSGQYGSLFYSPYVSLTYPVPFVGFLPVVSASCVYAGTENGVTALAMCTNQQGTLVSCAFQVQGGLATAGGRVGYIAVGRWY